MNREVGKTNMLLTQIIV